MAARGIEVRVWSAEPAPEAAPETPGADVLLDDRIGIVTHKLARAMGGPVYWCVWTTVMPDDHVDSLWDAFAGDLSMLSEALFGKKIRLSGIEAVRKRARLGAYVCPYAASGHPSRLPPNRVAQSVQLLEELYKGGHVVASLAAPEWAGAAEELDGTENVLEALEKAKPVPARDVGTRKVRAQHLVVETGTHVETTDLESVYNATQLQADGVVAATLHRADGSLAFRALEQAIKEGHIDAASVDGACRRMMRRGEEELQYVVRNQLVTGTARVHVDNKLLAVVSLRTESDAVSAIRSVFETPALVHAVKTVTRSVARVTDDVLDSGPSNHLSRHIMSMDGKGVNHLVTCIGRASPLLEYCKLENAVEVTMARRPGFVPSTVAATFAARRFFMVSQGRSAELVKSMASELSMSLEQAQAELAAYLQSRPTRDSRGVSLPSNSLMATVTTGPDGFSVSIECTCPLVYAERLLWCLQRCTNIGLVTSSVGADPEDTQAILKRLQESRANGVEDDIKSRYVLQRLYDADPDLFTRSKTPGFPMYSKICGAVDKRQPIAVDFETFASLKETDPDLASVETRGTTYICPEVWCPATETAMTAEAFKAAGNMCPGNRKGVHLSDVAYWKGATGRYPQLIGAERHPAGLCMPCCFKKNRGDVSEDADDPSYVMSAAHSPLPEGRFGRTGGITGLLRAGVPSSSAFVSALGYCMGADPSSVVDAIRAVATVRNMLRAKDLLVRFVDIRHAGRRESQYLQFLSTPAGKDHARACGVVDRKFSADDPKSVRSLALFDACEKYKAYVPGGTHSFVLPMAIAAYPAVLIGVFEQMPDSEVVVHTPLGGARTVLPKHGAMIMKTGNAYEPLVDANTKARDVRVESAYAKAVARAQMQARELSGVGALPRLQQELLDRGIDVRSSVVHGDTLDVAGVLTVDGVFIPLPEPETCTHDMDAELTWYEDLPSVKCSASPANVVSLFKELADSLDWDHLTQFREVKSGGNAIALVLDSGATVPLKPAPETEVLWSDARDAVVQFSRIAAKAPPIGSGDGVLALMDAMHGYLMENHTKEYWVLRHPLCPYSRDTRAARIMELSSPVRGEVSSDVVSRTINTMMTRQKRPKKQSIDDVDVLAATEDDVVDGALSAAISIIAAPEDHVDIVRRALSTAVDPQPVFGAAIELSGSWAAPLRGMTMFASDASSFESVAALSSAVGVANPRSTRKEYVDAIVADVVRATELGDKVESLGLHWSTNAVVNAELAKARKARTPLRSRLTRALLLKDDFKMGPGDLSRALSSRNRYAVVVHPSGAYVSGTGPRCVVLALKDDRVFVAKAGDKVVLTSSQLGKGVSKIVATRTKTG